MTADIASKRTPGPWVAAFNRDVQHYDLTIEPDDSAYMELDPDGPYVCADDVEEFIALAANTYDELLAVAGAAGEVMTLLMKHGPSIVPHLIDTDENAGQRLRDALAALDAAREKEGAP